MKSCSPAQEVSKEGIPASCSKAPPPSLSLSPSLGTTTLMAHVRHEVVVRQVPRRARLGPAVLDCVLASGIFLECARMKAEGVIMRQVYQVLSKNSRVLYLRDRSRVSSQKTNILLQNTYGITELTHVSRIQQHSPCGKTMGRASSFFSSRFLSPSPWNRHIHQSLRPKLQNCAARAFICKVLRWTLKDQRGRDTSGERIRLRRAALAASKSSLATDSSGLWLTPPLHLTNSIAT